MDVFTAIFTWCMLVVGGARQMPNRPSADTAAHRKFQCHRLPAAMLRGQDILESGSKER